VYFCVRVIAPALIVAASGCRSHDNAASGRVAECDQFDATKACIEKIGPHSCPAGTTIDCTSGAAQQCERAGAGGSIVKAADGQTVACLRAKNVSYGCKAFSFCAANEYVVRITRDEIQCALLLACAPGEQRCRSQNRERCGPNGVFDSIDVCMGNCIMEGAEARCVVCGDEGDPVCAQ